MQVTRYTRAREVQVHSTGPNDVTNYTTIYRMFRSNNCLFSERRFVYLNILMPVSSEPNELYGNFKWHCVD